MKYAMDFGEIKWDSRTMLRPNIYPGDVLRYSFGKDPRLMLVVHSSESSAKVIDVSASQLDDDEHVFSESDRGEYISSHICYNERGGGIKMVARIPACRIKMKTSSFSEARGPVGVDFVPISRHSRPKVTVTPSVDQPVKSVIDDLDVAGPPTTVTVTIVRDSDFQSSLEQAAVAAAKAITSTGPGS